MAEFFVKDWRPHLQSWFVKKLVPPILARGNTQAMTTPKKKITNVFEAILKYGHDEDFIPDGGDDFCATDAPAGSEEKIEVLRRRVEFGMPLWHGEDRRDYSGLTGAVRPRE